MAKTLDFIFDFASPNAYLCYRVLPPMLQRTGARLNLIPCLLGGLFKATGNQAPMTAFGAVKGKLAYEALETKRFVEAHRLTAYRFNPNFPMNSLLIMRGLVAAEMAGDPAPYVQAVLAAMWEDGKKMDDPEVVAAVLADAGLDAEEFIARTQAPEVKAKLASNTEAAAARGVFGIPTFFVGDEMFFGKERLSQVEAELTK